MKKYKVFYKDILLGEEDSYYKIMDIIWAHFLAYDIISFKDYNVYIQIPNKSLDLDLNLRIDRRY